ncbi:hypothetical protein [Brasilonema sp. UFV-L1]|nr:hypothetical protein [Brasilonema sp. UFV-L1]
MTQSTIGLWQLKIYEVVKSQYQESEKDDFDYSLAIICELI